MNLSDNLINISSLNVDFIDSTKPLKVFENLSLSIKKHEFLSIVGPSGCGKTSLLKLIGGLLDETSENLTLSGKITIDNKSPSFAKKSRLFGFAFQNPVLLPWRTVEENVLLPCELIKLDTKVAKERVISLLKLVGIDQFNKAYPHQLSGGMQQRVNLARTLVHEPSILLLDEPFGALDEMTRERLNDALLKLHNLKNTTIIFVTHNLGEAVFLSDRIIVLSSRPTNVYKEINVVPPQERNDSFKISSPYLGMLSQLRTFMSEIYESKV